MRLHAPLDDLLTGKASLAVLRVLTAAPGIEMTGREIAHRALLSPSQGHRVLHNLERQGLASSKSVGRADVWHVRSDHVLVKALKGLLEVERDLPVNLKRDVRDFLRPTVARRATLFGSVAESRETPESDVDLLIEVARDEDKESVRTCLMALQDLIWSRYGCSLSPVLHSRKDDQNPLARSLLEHARSSGESILDRGSST